MTKTETKTETTIKQNSGRPSFAEPLVAPFQLANWLVTPELNALENIQSKQSRSLEPRLMQLLCILAANSPRVLDRDFLVQQLWPNVIVNENSLTRAISELRKQLREGCENGAIETIPKRGYRLSCPVTRADQALQEKEENIASGLPSTLLAPAAVLNKSAFQLPRLSLLTVGFTALLVAAISNNAGTRSVEIKEDSVVLADELMVTTPDYLGGAIELSSAESSRLSSASITDPIVSHDGQHFAYLAYNPSGSTVYIGRLDKMDTPYPLYHDSGNLVNLAWSPVGDALLFTKQSPLRAATLFDQQQDSELLVLDIVTGKLQKLVKEGLPLNKQIISENSLT